MLEKRDSPHAAAAGFTLVEIAIVLVIIGLLVGGILVGRDLIRSAELRAQISQIEKYKASVNTFRLKYGYLPGDLRADQASQLGMTARAGISGSGDANGLIEACSGSTDESVALAGCEDVLFWRDLSDANLVDGHFASATDAFITASISQLPQYFPSGKAGNGNYVIAFSITTAGYGWCALPSIQSPGGNYFGITRLTQVSAGAYIQSDGLTPSMAYTMDTKIDDGNPTSGKVGARSVNLCSDPIGPTSCLLTLTTYNLSLSALDQFVCESYLSMD